MCLLGFGFLYGFLRRYGYSALGLTYLLSAVVMLESVVVVGAFQQVLGLVAWQDIQWADEQRGLLARRLPCAWGKGAQRWGGGDDSRAHGVPEQHTRVIVQQPCH